MKGKYYKTVMSIFLFTLLINVSCSNTASKTKDTPESLAQECCDCWQEMKSIQNSTARANKMDECGRLTQTNLYKLRQLGIDNDWNDEKVKDAEKRFDAIYDKCTQ